MKSSDTTIHIPSQLEAVALQNVSLEGLEKAKQKYRTWSESLPAETSSLNHRLYFLELLEGQTGKNLKEKKEIISALLEDTGVRKVGDQFDRVEANGIKKRWEVVWQKIGDRYGVEMGIKSQDGELLSGEFFD